MEQFSDAVTAITSNNRESLGMSMLRDHISDFSIQCTWLNNLNGFLETFPSCVDQSDRVRIYVSDEEGFVKISVMSIEIRCNINVDYISIFEGSAVRNSMTNDFVHRSTTRLRKMIIVKW